MSPNIRMQKFWKMPIPKFLLGGKAFGFSPEATRARIEQNITNALSSKQYN